MFDSIKGKNMHNKHSKRSIMFFILTFILAFTLAFLSPLMAFADKAPDAQAVYLQLPWLQKSILPADDFYTFANGTWQKNNPIPADYSSWSSFSQLAEKTKKAVH